MAMNEMSRMFQIKAVSNCVYLAQKIRNQLWITCIQKRDYAKLRMPQDPQQVQEMPVFQYATDNTKFTKRVYSWGLAGHGALGVSRFVKPAEKGRQPRKVMPRPYRVGFGEKHEVTDIACGYGFTLMATKSKNSHNVFGVGLNADSQIGYHCVRKGHPLELLAEPVPIQIPLLKDDSRVRRVACGRAHSVVLTEKDGVFTLGNNAYGQCGRKIIANEKYAGSQMVHQVKHLPGNVVDVVCGQDSTYFLTAAGQVFACGWGADGQTGLGHYNNQGLPEQVVGDIRGEKIVKLSCRADCVLALNDRGEVFGWGNSEYGQLRLATSDMQIHTSKYLKFSPLLGKITDVAAAGSSCMVLNDEGRVFVWGYGLLGKGPTVKESLEPVEIPPALFGRHELNPDSRVASLTCGINQLGAINSQGDLYTWGRNRGSCLGLGHDRDQPFPFKVAISAQVVKVEFGVDHCVALCHGFI